MAKHKTLGYFGPEYDSPQAFAVRSRYAIFSAPRTGSNYLCVRLGNFRDALGIPMEYIHADAIAESGARALGGSGGPTNGPPTRVEIEAYVQALERLRTTADGGFGLKLQPAQLFSMTNGDLDRAVSFRRRFDRVVVLLRKDKLAQAISRAVARETGRWFNCGDEVVVSRQRAIELFPLIAKLLSTNLMEDAFVDSVVTRLATRPTLALHDESLLEDRLAVTRQIVQFLKPGSASLPPEDARFPVTERPSGQATAGIRAEFLAHVTNSASS